MSFIGRDELMAKLEKFKDEVDRAGVRKRAKLLAPGSAGMPWRLPLDINDNVEGDTYNVTAHLDELRDDPTFLESLVGSVMVHCDAWGLNLLDSHYEPGSVKSSPALMASLNRVADMCALWGFPRLRERLLTLVQQAIDARDLSATAADHLSSLEVTRNASYVDLIDFDFALSRAIGAFAPLGELGYRLPPMRTMGVPLYHPGTKPTADMWNDDRWNDYRRWFGKDDE